ncbi:MAG: phosphoglucosamine mutase [bacterium]|nr:phosphoglucosamine mutase [bacterium]
MASQLMKSVSGIRGVVGETLTPELIMQVASAFAKFVKKGSVVLGRDSRPTGETISDAVKSILALSGCDVIDVGIVPTPTVEIMVRELNAAGGIIISASHNPIEWNAFKLVTKNGTFLNSREIEKFFAMMEEDFKYMKWNKVGSVETNNSAGEIHIKKVLSVIDTKSIQKEKFKVALDSVNGAGSLIVQELLSRLNCAVVPLYCDPNGIFPRGAEPTPENLADLAGCVKKNKVDIGFALDPDADRLAIVDEQGKPIGEEGTLALVTEHLLSKEKGRVVINLSTSKMIDDIAARYGVPVKRTKVGEINVTEEMIKRGARIGGEGNGGVISPEINMGRDSLAGVGYILQMMAERGKKLSELVSELPVYVMKKGKVKFNRETFDDSTIDRIKETYKNEKLSEIDGLRIDFVKDKDFAGGWVHLRPSNTEPIFRIMTEAETDLKATKIYKHFAKMF